MPDPTRRELQTSPSVGLFTATCIVVANMVGTGIFTTLGFQVVSIRSGFALMSLWVVGGLYALCGALSYGELARLFPRSGGEYHYLSRLYHPSIGFLAGWVSFTVGFTAPVAAAAMALGAYLHRVVPTYSQTWIAVMALLAVTVFHIAGLPLARAFQNTFSLIKVLLILIFCVCGLVLAERQHLVFAPSRDAFDSMFGSAFPVAMVFVAYAYSGWNASVYLAEEVRESRITVPKSLLLGTTVVMGLYCTLNYVFLRTTPLDELSGQIEVGYLSGTRIFGPTGSSAMACLIAIGLVSSISAMTWAGPRVVQVLGEDFQGMRALSFKNRAGVPFRAVLFQSSLALLFVLTSSFEAILTYLSFTLMLSTLATVVGLLVVSSQGPALRLSPATAIRRCPQVFFILVTVWVLVFLMAQRPMQSLLGVATVAAGLPVYWFLSRR